MYAKLVSWEVINFMSIKHGVCEFDEKNIVVLKGYNDSGKSAMLRALDVLFYNRYPQSQVSFIKDGCSYFRIMAKFDDGVIILRDKYANGQSLYEMYQNNEVIFSTKVGNVLTKVGDVPEPIQQYLGVVQDLCTRSCYEKQLLVQTSGRENDKLFNVVLKSEELAKAQELINNDKNTLASEISTTDTQLHTYKSMMKDGEILTEEIVAYMENLDKEIDAYENRTKQIEGIKKLVSDVNSFSIAPEVSVIDLSQYQILNRIEATLSALGGIKVAPEVQTFDTNRYGEIMKLHDAVSMLGKITVSPEITLADTSRLSSLIYLSDGINKYNSIVEVPEVSFTDTKRLEILSQLFSLKAKLPNTDELDKEIEKVHVEMQDIVKLLGKGTVICPDCGHIITESEVS